MASKSLGLNKLELSELYLLPAPIKFVIFLFIIVAIMVGGYFFMFSDQLNSYHAEQQKENDLRQSYKDKAAQAANLPVLEKELEELRQSFAILIKQLPTDKEVPTLIQELHQAGSGNGLRMAALTPQAPHSDGEVEILPYTINISGTYEQLAKFAKDVGSLSRIVVLNSMQLAPSGKGKLTLNALANTYQAKNLPNTGDSKSGKANRANQ